MSLKNVDILIIGGGIGGLTTAIACGQAGFSTMILERASRFSEVGAGIWIAPNAMQVFDMLEIATGLFKHGYQIKQINLASTYSGELQVIDLQRYQFNILAIHRAKLQHYLAQCIPQENIRFESNIDRIEQDDTGISVQLVSGETFTAKILVAADGLNSQVRRLIFGIDGIRYSGSSSFRGIAKLTNPGNIDNTSYEIWAPGCKFGFSFISPHEKYWYLSFKAKQQNYLKQDEIYASALAMVTNHFVNQHDLILQTDLKQIIQTDLCDLWPLLHWSNKRICLLGDAAHATTPNLGQGAGQAIEDAMALSLALKKYGLNAKALNRYHKIRHKKAEYLVKKARSSGKISEWSSPLLQAVRDVTIHKTPHFIVDKMMDKIFTPEIE